MTSPTPSPPGPGTPGAGDDAGPPAADGRPKVLVSACLLGHRVRYNGSAKLVAHPLLQALQDDGRLVVACPELMAGFNVPRPPAEIAQARDGRAVLAGEATVSEASGRDVTAPFVAGARAALALARQHGCRYALLTDGSPSCGSGSISDGSFSGIRHGAAGVTATLLRQHGIEVFAESEIDELGRRI